MKDYTTLLALSTEEREVSFKASSLRADRVASLRSACEKHVAKLLNAMIASKECEPGKLREKSILLTGKDIRSTLQDVYGLVNVFGEILAETIELTEADFDSMDKSKLALLSTFLGEKHRDKLPAAIEAAKTGTAKEMRDLKPKEESKDAKEIKSLKEKLHDTAAKGTPITFGFIATDIGADAPLITSVQALTRLKADFVKATEAADDESLIKMMNVFGKMLLSVSAAMDCDAKEWLDELASGAATPAAGATVETPALEMAAA